MVDCGGSFASLIKIGHSLDVAAIRKAPLSLLPVGGVLLLMNISCGVGDACAQTGRNLPVNAVVSLL